MRNYVKYVAMVVLPVFMLGVTGCNQSQINSAKNVLHQAEFYVDMAEALVRVANAQFADKPKVQTALTATVAALGVVKKAMKTAESGLSKDYESLKAAVVTLVVEVFALAKAIKEAEAANKASSTQ
jgi:hypothetical protein